MEKELIKEYLDAIEISSAELVKLVPDVDERSDVLEKLGYLGYIKGHLVDRRKGIASAGNAEILKRP